MPKCFAVFFAAALLTLTTHAQASVQAAEAAALAWLTKVDNSQYEEAWEAASPLLRTPLSPAMLQRVISLSRQDLGALQSRNRIRVSQYTSMPGAPAGDFKILTFRSRFENQSRLEVVTPHLENGEWRVSGYYME
ncbi:DUF4019 domain-containing protein [Halomonas sp. SIMBA_159]